MLLYSGSVSPETLTSISIIIELGELNDEVRPMPLNQLDIRCVMFMVFDSADLGNGHTYLFGFDSLVKS